MKKDSRPTAHWRGYNRAWQEASKAYRKAHPVCVLCYLQDRGTPATCVDHIIPHGMDYDLFWDQQNWQSLCHSCHRIKTERESRGRLVYWKGLDNRWVIYGEPGVGKTAWLKRHAEGRYWDMDLAATNMGYTEEYPRPQYQHRELVRLRTEFIEQAIADNAGCWMAYTYEAAAFSAAERLTAHLLALWEPGHVIARRQQQQNND